MSFGLCELFGRSALSDEARASHRITSLQVYMDEVVGELCDQKLSILWESKRIHDPRPRFLSPSFHNAPE
jgi:hypothetical protein